MKVLNTNLRGKKLIWPTLAWFCMWT